MSISAIKSQCAGSNGKASYKRPVSYLDSSVGENDTDGLYDISDMMGRDDKRAKFDSR